MSDNLLKVSSQGVRDFRVRGDTQINDDIGDVYNKPPKHSPPHFDTNKQTVSKEPVTKRRRFVKKRLSIDAERTKHPITALDLTLRASKFYLIKIRISRKLLSC